MTRNFTGIDDRGTRARVFNLVRVEASTRLHEARETYEAAIKNGLVPDDPAARAAAYTELVRWYLGPGSYSLEEIVRKVHTDATRAQRAPPERGP